MFFKVFVQEIDVNGIDGVVPEGSVDADAIYIRFLPDYSYPRRINRVEGSIWTLDQNHRSIKHRDREGGSCEDGTKFRAVTVTENRPSMIGSFR